MADVRDYDLNDTLEEPLEQEDTFDEAGEDVTAPAEPDTQEEEEEIDWKERYKNLERKLGEQGEELGRLRSLLGQYQQMQPQFQQPQQPKKEEYKIGDKLFEDPDAALNEYAQYQRQQMMQEMAQLMEAQRREQEFWEKNKDLKPYEDFIRNVVAPQVMQQYPYASPDERAELIARKAKERISAWQRQWQQEQAKRKAPRPPRVTSPSSARAVSPQSSEPEEDDYREYFALRSKMRHKPLF